DWSYLKPISDTVDVVVDAMGYGSTFRIHIAESYGNGGYVSSGATVAWGEAQAPQVRVMNPGNRIPFTAISGT
ncbi:MAG TPA: hypothetical protein VF263_10025, partial [Longimicrobiaceae bacterium]